MNVSVCVVLAYRRFSLVRHVAISHVFYVIFCQLEIRNRAQYTYGIWAKRPPNNQSTKNRPTHTRQTDNTQSNLVYFYSNFT